MIKKRFLNGFIIFSVALFFISCGGDSGTSPAAAATDPGDVTETATCSDGIKNQDETGIDCGGITSTCGACTLDAAYTGLEINEVSTSTVDSSDDYVEIVNNSGATIDIKGCYFADNHAISGTALDASGLVDASHKIPIPTTASDTEIAAGGFLLVYFNDTVPDADNPLQIAEKLGGGDSVVFVCGDNLALVDSFNLNGTDFADHAVKGSYSRPSTGVAFEDTRGTPGVANTGGAFTVGGDLSGYGANAVGLSINGSDAISVTADGGFTFTGPYPDGGVYKVDVSTQPVDRACVASVNTGTISGANVTDVVVTCGPPCTPAVGSILINELSSKGSDYDPSGNGYDWIELFNTTGSAIDLAGCYLTDSSGAIAETMFTSSNSTATTVPANGYLTVGMETYGVILDYQIMGEKIGKEEAVQLIQSDGVTVIHEWASDATNGYDNIEGFAHGIWGLCSDTITLLDDTDNSGGNATVGAANTCP